MSKPGPSSHKRIAHIALGSNLGDRASNIHGALKAVGSGAAEVVAVSDLIETRPEGGPAGQGSYLNGAACVHTPLNAEAFLELLLAVERQYGRIRSEGVRNGPRTIDLDLLLFDDLVLDSPGLCVPHPRMHLRAFVLRPLAQIAPRLRHPTLGKTVVDLLSALDSQPPGR